MWRKALALSLFFCALMPCWATTYYVAANGNDARTAAQARNPSTPWATISHVQTVLQPGDTVIVAPGNYPSQQITITASGRAGAPITFRGGQPQPRLTSFAGSTLRITRSHYLIVDGFDVTNTDHVVDSTDGGNGIYIDGGSTHITISHCTVHDCGGGGIGTGNQPDKIGCDYITIRDCTVCNNAWDASYNCSGISLWMQSNSNPQDTGFHNDITGNICFGNSVKNVSSAHTDGEGIILDVSYNHSSQQGGIDTPSARTYIGHNTCYANGGSGIEVFRNDGTTVDHNTCYHNAQDVRYTGGGGELWLNDTRNCTLASNVAVSSGSTLDKCLSRYADTGTVLTNNDFWQGTAARDVTSGNTIGDPDFKNPTATPPDFRVLAGGPADPSSGVRGAWKSWRSKAAKR